MSAAPIITAGIDVQANGLSVRLSFSLDPAASGPSFEGWKAGDASAAAEDSPEQVVLRSAAAAVPALHAAFGQAQSIVQASQCLLLEREVAALRSQSTQGADSTYISQALSDAERFIQGFADDATQEGVYDLLLKLQNARVALGGRTVQMTRREPSANGQEGGAA
jgi:hypothetical protein